MFHVKRDGILSPAGGKDLFRLRAGYFPRKESSQSSPGQRTRTQESHPAILV